MNLYKHKGIMEYLTQPITFFKQDFFVQRTLDVEFANLRNKSLMTRGKFGAREKDL